MGRRLKIKERDVDIIYILHVFFVAPVIIANLRHGLLNY